ncbi:MAG: F0F1 ATP synthase subunit A [Armatimonadetes bacterium]|nr:F0F1 ATP synthase subunit A [Anaerolineae bacterium]
MTNPRIRGLIVFGIIIFVAVVFCAWLPFVGLPGAGIGMALPVIEVPGEVLVEGGWFGNNLTNTLTATLFADFIVLLFAFLAWRASKGWTNEVPGKFQALVETLVEGLYNFLKGIGGDRLRNTRRPIPLWPLVATIFLFLLAANLSKLFPGMESVGKMHCSHVGLNGYPIVYGATDGSYVLFVDEALDAGTEQTEEAEHICEEYFYGWSNALPAGFPLESASEIEEGIEAAEVRIAQLEGAGEASITEESKAELEDLEYYVEFAPVRIASAEALEGAEARLAEAETRLEQLEETKLGLAEAAEGHSEDTAVEEGASESAVSEEGAVEAIETEAAAATEESPAIISETAVGTEEAIATEEAIIVLEGENTEGAVQETVALLDSETLEDEIEAQKEVITTLATERDLIVSQTRFPGATLPLSTEQLDRGAIPYIFHVTPFFRGAATDLSLAFALAIIAVVMIQVYGVSALGPAYFEKFINLSALGNLNKKPLGAIDFIVGLIEIISEIGKIVSLAFRLFGNIFAGGVALLAISFLVSLLVPGIIYGLELIIGPVQALVFCVLTLVFSVQAMESHHGDDHDEHGHDDHATEATH